MRAINHALTGAVIGLAIHEPLVALPAALLSHLVCDAIPHHGSAADNAITSRWFAYSLVLDALLCGALVLVLLLSGTQYWLLAATCAFIAASPDLLSIRKYIAALRHKDFTPNALENFLKKIQWFERPIGGVVEVAWFIAGIAIVSVFL